MVSQNCYVRGAAERKWKEPPKHLRRSGTFDNGKEFAEHEALALAIGMKIFLALSYCVL